MKVPVLNNILNQHKPVSHIIFFIFSLIVTTNLVLSGQFQAKPSVFISVFIMLFLQLEVFIFFGNILFVALKFDRSPGEITRIVLFRFMLFLAICLFASMILFVLLEYSVSAINGKDLSNVLPDFIHKEMAGWFKSTLTGLSLGAIIFIVILWQSSLRREQKLREEKLIFQNETLKSQVNPHFLFNSLNTLSSLIATHPDVAEEFVNRLSSIYRYILDNSRRDKVPLQAELKFIEDYFQLHKIRDEGKIQLKIDAPDAGSYEILPVSLQILMENAIKHNMATRESPLQISIFIEEGMIVMKNNLQRMAFRLKSTGLGLNNLGERVRIVSKRDLIIEETDNYFTVKLPLLK